MLIVQLSSGLGNQLFMYSFFMYLKQETNEEVFFETKSFKNDFSNRESEIELLFPSYPVFNDMVSSYRGDNMLKNFFSKLYLNYLEQQVIEINDSEIYKIENTYNKDVKLYFYGFWQTNFYVDTLINKSEIFTPKEIMPKCLLEHYKQIISSKISVSMHVRRGDYFTDFYLKRYGVCTKEYFEDSIYFLIHKLDKFVLFIFSDDIEWVKKNLKFPDSIKLIYIQNYDVNNFWYINLMSLCHHNIISNSSFSWWGAYLNKNKFKIVISPKVWRFDIQGTLALKEWIKI